MTARTRAANTTNIANNITNQTIAGSVTNTIEGGQFQDVVDSAFLPLTDALTGDLTTTPGATTAASLATTLATVNSNVGTFGAASTIPIITVNAKGLITAVSTAADPAITALTGDATASGAGSQALTLATVNTNTGTFGSATTVPVVTVNGKGLVTAVTTATITGGSGITALTGDVAASGTGSVAATLATVNSNTGTFGSATQSAVITVNAKGLVTAVSTVAITGGSATSPAGTTGAIQYNNAGAFGGLNGTGLVQSNGSSAPTIAVTPVLGVAGTSQGSLGLSGATSGTVTIGVQAAAGTYNFNLPTTAGTTGQVFVSGGGGTAANVWTTFNTVATGTVGTLARYTATGTVSSDIITSDGTGALGAVTSINGPTTALLLIQAGAGQNLTLNAPVVMNLQRNGANKFTIAGTVNTSLQNFAVAAGSNMTLGGGLQLQIVIKTAAYTALASDCIIRCNGSTSFTVTAPTTPSAGQVLYIKNRGTVSMTFGGTVDGTANPTIAANADLNIAYDATSTEWIAL